MRNICVGNSDANCQASAQDTTHSIDFCSPASVHLDVRPRTTRTCSDYADAQDAGSVAAASARMPFTTRAALAMGSCFKRIALGADPYGRSERI